MRYIYEFWDFDDLEMVAFDIPEELVGFFNDVIRNTPTVWGEKEAIGFTGTVLDPIQHLNSLKEKTYKRKFFKDAFGHYKNNEAKSASVGYSGSVGIEVMFESADEYADYMMRQQRSVEERNLVIDALIKEFTHD